MNPLLLRFPSANCTPAESRREVWSCPTSPHASEATKPGMYRHDLPLPPQSQAGDDKHKPVHIIRDAVGISAGWGLASSAPDGLRSVSAASGSA